MKKYFILLTFCFILLVSCGSSQTKPGNISNKNNSSDIASSSNKTNNFETLARLPEPLEPRNKRLDEISDNDYFFFDKDLVYYTNNKSELVCYDYKKNKQIWHTDATFIQDTIRKTFNNDILMVATDDQRYLNIQNPARSIKWDSGLSDVLLYASDDRILFQDLNSQGEIRCYSPNDGKILWKFKTPGFGNAPGVFNSVLAFAGYKAIISEMYNYKEPGTPSELSHLFEFDINKGKILKMIDNCVSYSKVNNKKKLLITTQNGSIVESFMFNLESGNKEWSVEGSISDVWQDENYMLTAGSANKITKIDLSNGKVIWSHDYKGIHPFFESIENNILTITIASNPEDIAQEHSDEPWKVFDTYSTLKLDFESGKEIDYFISYDRTKSTQTPIKIKEYYHFDKFNIEKSYEVPLENIFTGIAHNEENLIVYDKSQTKIFEGVFKGYITGVYSFGDTFIVIQPKIIQAYKNGKLTWKTEMYSFNNDNLVLFDNSKNCFYYFDAKPFQGNTSFSELLEFDVEKGETGFSIKLDYASLNKDKDHDNPFKCNYGYKVENGFVNFIKLPEVVTQIVTNHFYY